jgi:hypothetical protein
MNKQLAVFLALVTLTLAATSGSAAQDYSRNLPPYRVSSNVTYVKNGTWEGKLDVYSRVNPPGPEPTLFWMHGGSVTIGSKDTALTSLMPYLELGWNVINVEHRQIGVTLAPETLQNSLCAVRWAMRNAGRYNIDVNKMVMSGPRRLLVRGCRRIGCATQWMERYLSGTEEPKVAAVVNWYGNWDLADILQGPTRKIMRPTGCAVCRTPWKLRAGCRRFHCARACLR